MGTSISLIYLMSTRYTPKILNLLVLVPWSQLHRIPTLPSVAMAERIARPLEEGSLWLVVRTLIMTTESQPLSSSMQNRGSCMVPFPYGPDPHDHLRPKGEGPLA